MIPDSHIQAAINNLTEWYFGYFKIEVMPEEIRYLLEVDPEIASELYEGGLDTIGREIFAASYLEHIFGITDQWPCYMDSEAYSQAFVEKLLKATKLQR